MDIKDPDSLSNEEVWLSDPEKYTEEIIYLDNPEKIVEVRIGSTVTYTGEESASAGNFFSVEYDMDAFIMKCKTSPNKTSLELRKPNFGFGGSSLKQYSFTAIKKGTFQIKIIWDFRGNEKEIVYSIHVQ